MRTAGTRKYGLGKHATKFGATVGTATVQSWRTPAQSSPTSKSINAPHTVFSQTINTSSKWMSTKMITFMVLVME